VLGSQRGANVRGVHGREVVQGTRTGENTPASDGGGKAGAGKKSARSCNAEGDDRPKAVRADVHARRERGHASSDTARGAEPRSIGGGVRARSRQTLVD
jgi:hypothetical protein